MAWTLKVSKNGTFTLSTGVERIAKLSLLSACVRALAARRYFVHSIQRRASMTRYI